MRLTFLVSLLAALSFSANGQRVKSALLPASEAKGLAEQCSRESPRDFTSTWTPTPDQITQMESRLSLISRLKAGSCCVMGARIEAPEDWYMQYVGLVWKGRKIIYINAVSTTAPTIFSTGKGGVFEERVSDDWKSRADNVCDGGTNWGVIYDLKKGKFMKLAVNGM